jgi:hypothetical protein
VTKQEKHIPNVTMSSNNPSHAPRDSSGATNIDDLAEHIKDTKVGLQRDPALDTLVESLDKNWSPNATHKANGTATNQQGANGRN